MTVSDMEKGGGVLPVVTEPNMAALDALASKDAAAAVVPAISERPSDGGEGAADLVKRGPGRPKGAKTGTGKRARKKRPSRAAAAQLPAFTNADAREVDKGTTPAERPSSAVTGEVRTGAPGDPVAPVRAITPDDPRVVQLAGVLGMALPAIFRVMARVFGNPDLALQSGEAEPMAHGLAYWSIARLPVVDESQPEIALVLGAVPYGLRQVGFDPATMAAADVAAG